MALDRFIALGLQVGSGIPYWVQGAGGNVSLKLDEKLYVKASGTRLDQFGKPTTLARIEMKEAQKRLQDLGLDLRAKGYSQALEETYAQVIKSIGDPDSTQWGRPSMETGFHVLMKGKFVLHFHALSSLLMAHVRRTKSAEFTKWLGGQKMKIQFLPPEKPGLFLSFKVADLPASEINVLESHGVILQGDSDDLLERWKEFESDFLIHFGWREFAAKLKGRPSDFTSWSASLRVPQKLQIFFPDSAVYKKELQIEVAQRGGSTFKTQFSNDKERGLEEILLATQLLSHMAPDLAEFPSELGDDLASIPTEKYRRGER